MFDLPVVVSLHFVKYEVNTGKISLLPSPKALLAELKIYNTEVW